LPLFLSIYNSNLCLFFKKKEEGIKNNSFIGRVVMRKPRLLDCAYILGLILFLTLTAGRSAWAGTVSGCTPETCNWSISVDGHSVMNGMYTADPETGDIILNMPVEVDLGYGLTVGLDMSGNIDPILGFAVSASTGSIGSTFGFTFNLPIALQGLINADSSVSYSLSSLSSAGAQITANGNIVTASEVDTSIDGLGFLNKGVDVGNTFGFLSPDGPLTQNSAVFTASNSFTGNLAYDLMEVKVDFALSPNSTVGISGFVQQLAVPIPAAVWLFGSGLLGLVGIARRKKA
jgi:hypothetical protein